MTSGVEFDPVFARALRLLQSRTKDSAIQLRAMLDDCLRQTNSPNSKSLLLSPISVSKKSEVESYKRNLDKLSRDLSEVVPASKKSRMDSPNSTKSHTPSPAPTSPGFFERGSTGSHSVQSGSSSSAEEMDVDLNLEGLGDCTCYICKSFNQENGNKLMECHTCQNLFHQECHVPIVSNEEAADPRLVWNCSDCSKTIKKVAAIKPPASSVSKGIKSSISVSAMKAARASPSKTEVNPSSGGKPAGMAAMTSYKSSQSGTSKHSSSSSSRSGRSGPGSSSSSNSSIGSTSATAAPLMTADKRLQLMKKKAAAQRKVR